MYYLLGTALALAALFAVNGIFSLTATAFWLCVRRSSRRLSAHARARLLFALRFAPPLFALIISITLVIPAYIVHEPLATREVVSLKLGLVALLSLCGICFAVWRGIARWRATRRLTAGWLRHAVPIRLDDDSIPAYRIAHPFPLIAIVGWFRPRLFIAEQVFETLDENEIAAAVAHETAHVAARDNLKRALLNFSRDVLLTLPCARALDDAWRVESEAAADEQAASGGAIRALMLAGVLVKIARMAPAGGHPLMPAGSYIAGDLGGIERRVRLLTQLATCEVAGTRERSITARMLKAFLFGLLGIILFEMTHPDVLANAHALLEFIAGL